MLAACHSRMHAAIGGVSKRETRIVTWLQTTTLDLHHHYYYVAIWALLLPRRAATCAQAASGNVTVAVPDVGACVCLCFHPIHKVCALPPPTDGSTAAVQQYLLIVLITSCFV